MAPVSRSSVKDATLRRLDAVAMIFLAVFLIACLYVARSVLVPLALGILLSFLLEPLVSLLERYRLGRVASVIAVVVLVTVLFAAIAWAIAGQLTTLAYDLGHKQAYRENIGHKLADLRGMTTGGVLTSLQNTVNQVMEGFSQAPKERTPGPRIVVTPEQNSSLAVFQTVLQSLLGPLGTAALVIVLVIFILLAREDLRNRLIRLFGFSRITVTTRALDDAARRIGRYLLMQFIVNSTYGLAAGTVLFLIGVPYALLWGFLAAVLRYVPYVGPWLAASLPIVISLVAFEGWWIVLLVVGAFVVLELLSNMVMEPLLYGRSVGVSVASLIVATAFWTWLWGPIGLVMATPLTVCLMVLGQHVPDFRFLAVLLGEEPALPPHASFYQRLIADDREEAADVVAKQVQAQGLVQTFDEVVTPGLVLARRARKRGELSAADESLILDTTREIVDEVATAQTAKAAPDTASEPTVNGSSATVPPAACDTSSQCVVLGCPAHHEAEEVMLHMLQWTLPCRLEMSSTRTLPSEVIARVGEVNPAAVFIAVVPPSGLIQAGYLCQEMRSRFPQLPIVVGYWGRKSKFDQVLSRLRSQGANLVTTSLAQSSSQLCAWIDRARQEKPVIQESNNPVHV